MSLSALLFAACGESLVSTPTIVQPSPTIAAAPIQQGANPTPTPELLIQPAAPAAAPTQAPTAESAPTSEALRFDYLWPAYLPDGMFISKSESVVANENQTGTTVPGFYLVTLNGANRKLVIGGGSTDTLPLAGEEREVQVDNAPARLIINGDKRQLVFTRNMVKFFIYSAGLNEDELLLIAESLVPINVADLRQQVEAAQ